MSLRRALRSGARAIGLGRPAPAPLVAYVVATPAAPYVRIDVGLDPIEISALVRFANPAATAGYILALEAHVVEPVARAARQRLASKAKHGGWFEATLDEAVAAIDESVKVVTGEGVRHLDDATLKTMAAEAAGKETH